MSCPRQAQPTPRPSVRSWNTPWAISRSATWSCADTHCGGLSALVEGIDVHGDPYLARWIEYARPAHTRTEALGLGETGEGTLLDRLVEENVRLQLAHVQEYDVIRRAAARGALELHRWVYELETSRVRYFEPVVDSFLLASG